MPQPLLKALLVCSLSLGVASCGAREAGGQSGRPEGGTQVAVWATIYNLVEGRTQSGGVPIRSMSGAVIGPEVARSDWCAGALAGTLRVAGQVYNYAGTNGGSQANCPHNPSERVRWVRSPHPYGTGAASNPLRPYRTIACDIGNVGGSTPWVNGGYPSFGQRLYIPAADGVVLPDGSTHDGIFTCEDTGGAVNGNHIDIFLGAAPSGHEALLAANPFPFVSHGDHIEVEAWLLPAAQAEE